MKWHPTGRVGWLLSKKTLFKFGVFRTPLEAVRLIASETGDPLMAGLSCTFGTYFDDMSVLLLFSGSMLGLWIGVLLGSFSRTGVNQVSLRLIFSVAQVCELHCTRSVQLWVIVPSLINRTVENSSSNTTWNWVDTLTVDGFRTMATDPVWNGEWLRCIPSREKGSHLGSTAILPWNSASNT